MPIKIPYDLPARPILEKEGVHLIRNSDAIRQDIRPLRIALLNLMPLKIKTETQIARVLANSPLQIEMTLMAPTLDMCPRILRASTCWIFTNRSTKYGLINTTG